ncbi:hypothetical protein GIB67_012710 [Kingdonia uniflora]|uniref:Transposase MuDR plant domain-containing protein n=1 Tax=Kingdonia uniflora TaxID=39325 RepID=A0A7J7NFH0_9MAGN|nr:hypothetical protein GIB67_012710 [Kingdonia uniflora]
MRYGRLALLKLGIFSFRFFRLEELGYGFAGLQAFGLDQTLFNSEVQSRDWLAVKDIFIHFDERWVVKAIDDDFTLEDYQGGTYDILMSVDGSNLYYFNLVKSITELMNDTLGRATTPPESQIELVCLCNGKQVILNADVLKQMWIASDNYNDHSIHIYIIISGTFDMPASGLPNIQANTVKGVQRTPTKTKVVKRNNESLAEKPKRLRSTYLPKEDLDELPDYFESDTEEDGDFDTEGVGTDDTKEEGDFDTDGVGGEDTGVGDEIVEKNVVNLVDDQLDPDNLEAEEGYQSTHSSQDGDDIPNENNLRRCDDFGDFVGETDNIFKEEENVFKNTLVEVYEELKVGMEWHTMYEARKHLRRFAIVNRFSFKQVKNEGYRLRYKCIDKVCKWLVYVRRQNDGHTMRLMNGVFVHNCKRKPGTKNRLANTLWVANEIEETVRDMKKKSPQDAMTIISRRYGVNLSYFTAWNAKTICMEKIIGSFDEGYTLMPELCRQILISNPSSIAKCSTDDGTKMWTGTCIAYKASLDGQKGLVDVVAQVFHHQNHRFCFRHFYKNFKKNSRGVHLERLSWEAAKAYVQEEKKKFLDKLDNDHPGARQWLEKKPYETWCRSHFDFIAKCKHVTNNFSESFNNWIMKVRDIPIHKSIENLNLMMMKLTYERRLKAKKWDQDSIVPRAQVEPPPLVRGTGRPRKVRKKDTDESSEKNKKRCGKCGLYGHNKKTCKGQPAPKQPRKDRQIYRVDTRCSRDKNRRKIGFDTPIRGENQEGRPRGNRPMANLFGTKSEVFNESTSRPRANLFGRGKERSQASPPPIFSGSQTNASSQPSLRSFIAQPVVLPSMPSKPAKAKTVTDNPYNKVFKPVRPNWRP